MMLNHRLRKVFFPAGLIVLACGAGFLAGRLRTPPAPEAAAQVVPSGNGDVNGDGFLDLGDPVYLLTYLFLDGSPPVPIEAPAAQTCTALIVRHAEKEDGVDPGLTPEGQARAEHLKETLARTKVDAVFATRYNRTIQTVKPAADARGLAVLSFPDADVPEVLVAALRDLPAGSTSLLAGNSFNLDEIVEALGIPEGVVGDDVEYDNLWVVRYGAEGTPGVLVHLRY
jgi:hypothetical protein